MTQIAAPKPAYSYTTAAYPANYAAGAKWQDQSRFGGKFKPHKMCHQFVAQGWCKKGYECTFAHSPDELHPNALAEYNAQQGYPAVSAGNWIAPASNGLFSTTPDVTAATDGSLSADAKAFVMPATLKFNAQASEFVPMEPKALNVDAPTFMPMSVTAAETDAADSSRRRPTPAPLQLDESPTISSKAPQSPQSPSATVIRTVVQPMMSPIRISTSNGMPLASPKAVSVMSSPSHVLLASPLGGRTLPAMMPSPAVHMTHKMTLSPRQLGSPQGPGLLGSPQPISRNALLQRRVVVQKFEQGPPGLANCAPTPTSHARKIGFRYPQPGWIITQPVPVAQGGSQTQ